MLFFSRYSTYTVGTLLVLCSLSAATSLDVCSFFCHADQPIIVTDWGVVGDGVHDDTEAMRELLGMTSSMGCPCQQPQHKHLVIPAHAIVPTYPLNLTSHTTLQVDGTLLAIASTEKWPIMPPVEIYGDGQDPHPRAINQYQSFLYAHNATNIRITGKGVIDANGPFWWDLFKKFDPLLRLGGRPNLYQTLYCDNLEIDSVTMKDSPFWTVHPILSKNIHIHHMKIRAPLYAPNVDGIDPDSCQNVMVEYNDISCGDDQIAIKAGTCGPGGESHKNCLDPSWTSQVHRYLTRNVTIRHNLFGTGMGIAVGSGTSGTIRDVFVYNNTVGYCRAGSDTPDSCGWGPALHVKTTISRSGAVENIIFDNNTVYNNSGFILVELNYHKRNQDNLPPDYPLTKVRNIVFRNNQALGHAIGATFQCDEKDPCHDITVINNTIAMAKEDQSPWGCDFIQSYNIKGNTPVGLEECMANSMNKSQPNSNDMSLIPLGADYTQNQQYFKPGRG